MVERHVSGDRLSAFLDDELDEDEVLDVTRHLARCDRCMIELEALRATRDALRALPSLQAPVLSAWAQARGRRRERRWRGLRRLVVATLVPAVIVGAAYLAGGEAGEVEPPTDLFLVEHLSRTGGGPVPSPVGGAQR